MNDQYAIEAFVVVVIVACLLAVIFISIEIDPKTGILVLSIALTSCVLFFVGFSHVFIEGIIAIRKKKEKKVPFWLEKWEVPFWNR